MDLFDVLRSCIRRWYIVLPLMVISGLYGYHIYSSVKPVFYSNAAVALAPPNSREFQKPDGTPMPLNGLLEQGGGAVMIANLAVLGLRDPNIVNQVVAAGGSTDYFVRMFPAPPGSPPLPLIMIDSTTSDPGLSVRTVNAAAAQVEPLVVQIQQEAGVPAEQIVRTLIARDASAPQAAVPSRTRSTLFTVGAGVGIAILCGVLFDVAAERLKERRVSRSAGSAGLPAGGVTDSRRADHEATAATGGGRT